MIDDEVELSYDQADALKKMLEGKNLLITGAAGTGKSTLISSFMKKKGSTSVVLAPTGCAAVNVNGQTIHSFFMFAPGPMSQDTIQSIPNSKKRKLIRQTETIIIDEISMVRSDLFVAIDYRLRELARGKNKDKPFGGKQMILMGDFFQLPPVIGSQIEMDWLCENLGGEYAFQTQLWEQSDFECICLKTMHRQKDDEQFLHILKNIRYGNIEKKDIADENGVKMSAIDLLNSTCLNRPPPQFEPIRLCTTNREATIINAIGKSKLKNQLYSFKAMVTGKFPEANYPTDAQLELAIGARVMILCNKRIPNAGFEYVNGDIGIVVGITNSSVPAIRIKLDSGSEVVVNAHVWSNNTYEMVEDNATGRRFLKTKVIGQFVQLPLKLAYAITIHKSQGLSLNYVDLRLGNGCFSHGQLYTALSRCKTLNGLRLERPISTDDLILDKRIVDFYKRIDPEDEDLNEQTKNNVSIEIPAEYKDKIKEYILKLKEEKGENILKEL